jgi:hypothetical protein
MGLTSRFAALAVLVMVSLSTAIGCSGNRYYDEEVRDAFLTNCEYAGSSSSVCIGALECIEERLTQSDLSEPVSPSAFSGWSHRANVLVGGDYGS